MTTRRVMDPQWTHTVTADEVTTVNRWDVLAKFSRTEAEREFVASIAEYVNHDRQPRPDRKGQGHGQAVEC